MPIHTRKGLNAYVNPYLRSVFLFIPKLLKTTVFALICSPWFSWWPVGNSGFGVVRLPPVINAVGRNIARFPGGGLPTTLALVRDVDKSLAL